MLLRITTYFCGVEGSLTFHKQMILLAFMLSLVCRKEVSKIHEIRYTYAELPCPTQPYIRFTAPHPTTANLIVQEISCYSEQRAVTTLQCSYILTGSEVIFCAGIGLKDAFDQFHVTRVTRRLHYLTLTQPS